ncbi:MAG: alpha-1,2-fucosyltransferase [Cytophagales bacterium]|nr:MAG: alpha-1,2-fucosyltransferase [Cytophagales bacterium]
MVIVKLLGGLGNQLFQYAIARHLAIINDTEVLLDTTAFEDFYKLHKYSLQHFSIKATIAKRTQLEAVYNFPHNLTRLQRLWQSRILGKKNFHLIEEQFNYQPNIIKKYAGNVSIDGYWQTEKYFLEIADMLRQELKIITSSEKEDIKVLQNIQKTDSVSLHIRRADYTNPETALIHGLCSIEYYQEAVKNIADKIPNPTFFIFSDDITWAEENLKLDFPMVFVGHNNADKNYEDLRMMSTCQHHIIANSSFSWWGAWLNPNPNKVVIAPQKWFSTNERNYQDVVPNNWIKL